MLEAVIGKSQELELLKKICNFKNRLNATQGTCDAQHELHTERSWRNRSTAHQEQIAIKFEVISTSTTNNQGRPFPCKRAFLSTCRMFSCIRINRINPHPGTDIHHNIAAEERATATDGKDNLSRGMIQSEATVERINNH